MTRVSWNPPANPDPQEILNAAAEDTRNGRYAIALEKHLWFHKNALSYEQGLGGVRLSFALTYWHGLAQEYPPAMECLFAARTEAEDNFLTKGFGFDSFHDLAALNRELDLQQKTVDAFRQVHNSDREAALRVYHVAEAALIRSSEFKLCGAYLRPEDQFEMAVKCFRLTQQHEKSRANSNPRLPSTSKPRFTNTVTTLIALLVINDRKSEAERIALRARQELNDHDFIEGIKTALNGTVPSSYP